MSAPTPVAGRAALDAQAILSAHDLGEPLPLHIPEWGGLVYIRQMTGLERDAFELACMAPGGAVDRSNLRGKLAVMTVCDIDGRLLFRPEQAAELGAKSGRALARIWELAAPHNGITEADADELLKNSDGARSGSNG